MDGGIAKTYTLIYRFLKKQTHVKAAKAVKKAAKGVVVLRDDVELDGPQLDEIVNEWEAQRKKSSTNASASRKSNDSKDDQHSKVSKKIVDHKPSATPSSVKTKPSKNRKKSTAASSASESSCTEDEAGPEDDTRGTATLDAQPSRSSPSLDPSDSGSESDTGVSGEIQSEKLTKSDLAQPEGEARVTKKQRVSEKGPALATAVEIHGDIEVQTQQNNGKKTPRKTNERFQRVKSQNVEPDFLVDNKYEAKARPNNDYGERAHRDLIVTRGSGFRKEKNKKKRGSYRGGEITLENHSIKFDD